jgi:predicted MPP superfamily phosphohydrolase
MRRALAVPLGLAAAGLSAATYGWAYERKAFRLRRVEVPILAPGSPRLTVLHVSDLHATPGQPWKVAWVRSLAELEPDLVINTGDNLASMQGAAVVLDALGPLLERPGAFVPGSNDWFAPVPKNPARYLMPVTNHHPNGPPLPWGELRASFSDAGWFDLTHRRRTIVVRGVKVELAGVCARTAPSAGAVEVAERRLAARLSRSRDLAVRAGQVLLPA